jgi:anti-sigma B factor antagonist
MKIEVSEKPGITVVRLAGSLDSNTTPVLEAQLLGIIETGTGRILVDLSEVDFVSSVGLRAFLFAARRLAPGGGALSVCGPNEAVRETFDISRFSELFRVYESEQDALEDQGGG